MLQLNILTSPSRIPENSEFYNHLLVYTQLFTFFYYFIYYPYDV